MNRHYVWDLPTRLFHWLLAGAVVFAVVSGYLGGGLIEWHGRAGLFILGLLAFRLVWGVIGGPTARFVNFVRGPTAIRAYLRGEWRGIGHNPLGALAVLALLGLLGAQVATGLFANDDIAFSGPLAALVSSERSGQLTGLHVRLFYVLAGIVSLHLAAIVYYARFKRRNLVLPMLSGWDEAAPLPEAEVAPVTSLFRRIGGLTVASVFALAAVYAAAGGCLPAAAPAPQVQQAAPGW